MERYTLLGIISILKLKVLLNEVNSLSCLMGKITVTFFGEFEKMTLHMEGKLLWKQQAMQWRKNKAGAIKFPDLYLYERATVTETAWYQHMPKHGRQERERVANPGKGRWDGLVGKVTIKTGDLSRFLDPKVEREDWSFKLSSDDHKSALMHTVATASQGTYMAHTHKNYLNRCCSKPIDWHQSNISEKYINCHMKNSFKKYYWKKCVHTQNNETRSVSLRMTKTNSETDNRSFEKPELTCCYNI